MKDVIFRTKSRDGRAVANASLLAAYPNGTYLTGHTDAYGNCPLELYRTDQEMKILVAAEGYLPFYEIAVPGKRDVMELELEPSRDERNSLLFTQSAGYIPGVEGSLNPHKDGYVYGDNLAINGRLAHPAAPFKVGESLHLMDVFGVETTIRFLVVEGQFSLIEYTKPKAYEGK